LDLDNDKKISKDELKTFLQEFGTVAASTLNSTGYFATFGMPTLTGGINTLKHYEQLSMEAELNSLMEKYDKDKNSTLDEEEFWLLCKEYITKIKPEYFVA